MDEFRSQFKRMHHVVIETIPPANNRPPDSFFD